MTNQNKHVSWTVFVWVIGIILIVFGIAFNIMAGINGKVENHDEKLHTMSEDVAVIRTDVGWIKKHIEENGFEAIMKK